MKKEKLKLEVIDFSKSTEEWQQEMFEDGVNIGVLFWVKDEDYMFDQDILSSFPEVEDLDLGEIWLDDNGFLALQTDKTVAEVKENLFNNDFFIK